MQVKCYSDEDLEDVEATSPKNINFYVTINEEQAWFTTNPDVINQLRRMRANPKFFMIDSTLGGLPSVVALLSPLVMDTRGDIQTCKVHALRLVASRI